MICDGFSRAMGFGGLGGGFVADSMGDVERFRMLAGRRSAAPHEGRGRVASDIVSLWVGVS